jgi:hypothetical protein
VLRYEQDNFNVSKSGGLREKHATTTWDSGNVSLQTEEKQEMCREGGSQYSGCKLSGEPTSAGVPLRCP